MPTFVTVPRSTLLPVLAGLLLVLASAGPAFAHAQLTSSSPSAGATLGQPPPEVVLTFNETIEPDFNQLQVTDPDGARVDAGAATSDGPTVSVPLQGLAVGGTYTVAYRVISADGHPVEGSFTFEVDEAAIAAAPVQEPETEPDPPEVTEEPEPESDPSPEPTPTPEEGDELDDEVDDTEEVAATETDDGGLPLALIGVLVIVALGAVALITTRRGGAKDPDSAV